MFLDRSKHGSSMLWLIALVLLLAPYFMWSTRADLRAATQRYAALEGAPTQVYRVVDRFEELRPAGRSNKTHYLVQLTPQPPRRKLSPAVTVEVSEERYETVRNGESWEARMSHATPMFDPMETRYEYSNQRWARTLGPLAILIALLIAYGHLSGRIYRS